MKETAQQLHQPRHRIARGIFLQRSVAARVMHLVRTKIDVLQINTIRRNYEERRAN